MNERSVLTALIKHLKKEFPEAWIYHPADRFHSGIPDILICLKGRFIAIEVKLEKGRLDKIQAFTLSKIRDSGGKAEICWGKKDIQKCIDVVRSLE